MKKAASKIPAGALILGIGAITAFLVFREKKPSLDEIGKMVGHVGEILANPEAESPENKGPQKKGQKKGDTVNAVVDWVATGIHLWKKLKK